MRLATLDDGTPDGALVVVSPDGTRVLPAQTSLIAAIADWPGVLPVLQALAARLALGQGDPLGPAQLRAPMPRSWQWLDGSAFNQHGELMQIAFNQAPIETDRPLMYQGLSDRFYGPTDPIPFASEADGIDFEGEFGVIVDAVPMGVTAHDAAAHIRLIVQINDWSLRAIAPIEMKTGFGWIQAKPACSMAPFAVTPDELVAHAARTRDLVAGTIIGSGTVSNRDYATRGSACISERRAIEIIAHGQAQTAFMAIGDSVQMEGRTSDGRTPFGAIDQVTFRA